MYYIYIYILDEKNSNIVTVFKTKVREFIDRAEYLKKCIKEGSQPKLFSSNTTTHNNMYYI